MSGINQRVMGRDEVGLMGKHGLFGGYNQLIEASEFSCKSMLAPIDNCATRVDCCKQWPKDKRLPV